jgi:menaquinone-dependent protoporphyrinogen oxidase
MGHILVTYATMSGSTAEVAEAVGKELETQGYHVDLLPIHLVADIQQYDAVVVGAPMILGWHREARRFLRKFRSDLRTLPWAVFATAMSLTATDGQEITHIPIFVDERLPKQPEDPDRLSIRERYATAHNYLRSILRVARPEKPASVAFFGGRLNYGQLKWWALIFAMLIVREQAGDKRNWEAIRSWAKTLPAQMALPNLQG